MNVLLTYDISNGHSDVKKELISMGYFDSVMEYGSVKELPNTTFFKQHSDSLQQTVDDFKKAVNIAQKTSSIKIKSVAAWEVIINYKVESYSG